ncbi:MAG: sigma-70 family RNA polymerase sigma factor [Mycobacteriales bacterium]
MNRFGSSGEDPDVKPPASRPRTQSEAPVEDATLVGRIRSGDGEALAALYERYGAPCYSLARRILGDEQLAQDVVQEVFLALWKDAQRYDANRGGFATWLLSMTHHKAVDVVRREENLRKRRSAAEAQENFAPPVPQPDDQAWASLRRDRVRAALSRLPDRQREALGLAYYGGYTQREIAGLTASPLGTVKTRMFAGMKTLRGLLDVAVDEAGEAGTA